MYELYMLETCPYCRKVIDYLKDNKIKFLTNDISDAKYRNELLALGGKEQVPYLYNPETKSGLYESDEIIEFLKNEGDNYEK